MPKRELIFEIHPIPQPHDGDPKDKWTCVIHQKRRTTIYFCGTGRSITEAIGSCVMANREQLGMSMFGTTETGEDWVSTNAPQSTRELALKVKAKKAKKLAQVSE